jgi:peptide/nickel transport system substrate-binding protein
VEATIGDIDTLDPALAYDTASATVIFNVYETLVFYDGESTDKFVPQLAESWELSDDGTVYTFHIRPGVTFHEGGELTASDVAYSYQRGILQGSYSSPQWMLAEPFFGVGNDDISIIVDGGASADDRAAMQAADPAALVAACEQIKAAIVADDAAGTVTMTLAQPWGPFLPTIANAWGSIMDQEWVVANGGWDGSCDTWQNFYAMTAAEDPFTGIANGTGAFKLERWTPGEEIVLARNENYWREPAKLERVVIQGIDEWGTRFAMLQAGDADVAVVNRQDAPQVDPLAGEWCTWNLDTESYDCEAVGDGPLRVRVGRPGLTQDVILFTFDIATAGNPYVGSGALDGNGVPADFFADANIRKGFAYAFDYQTLIDEVFLGEAVQPVSLPLPGMPGYDANAPHYTFDLAAAEAAFKAADLDHDGIPAGDDPEGDVWTTGFRVQMLYNLGNTSRQNVAEIMAANLAVVNPNFRVEVLGLPWPSYLTAQRASQIPVMTGGWLEDIHDPHNWYQPYTTGTYGNRQRLPEALVEQFREYLNAGVAETDPAARHQIYLDFNQAYYENVPGVPIVNATGHGFSQRWVQGQVLNAIFPGNYYYTIYKD